MEELRQRVAEWLVNHPNPYNRSIEEDVYWTMEDIHKIICVTDSSNIATLEKCEKIFNRFKYWY
jgi:hypothetical protein